MSIFNFTG